jgi:chromosome partitioning protein
MKLVVMLNNKGGVGKTTSAVNISALLAQRGYKILLIDLDPSACASLHLGFDKSEQDHKTLCDYLLASAQSLDDYIYPVDSFERFFCVPSEPALSDFYEDLRQEQEAEFFIDKTNIPADYDLVIFDSPPNMGSLTINALAIADYVLLPVQTQYLALSGLDLTVKFIERAQRHLNADLRILGYFGTQFDKRTNASKEVLSILRKKYGPDVFKTAIGVNTKLIEAYHARKPITKYSKSAKGAREYEALTEEIIKRIQI